MLRYDSVLVPLDGSEAAERAMRTADVLAERFGANLDTITVFDGSDRVERRRDPVAAAVARRHAELPSPLVAMATHGRGRLAGALLGSVARAVLQRTGAPLIVLGPQADNPGWSPRPRSWPAPLSIPRVVACVDTTDAAEQILPVALEWSGALDASLTILTVTDGDARSVRQGQIEALVERWGGAGVDVDGHVQVDPIGVAEGVRAHLAQRPAGLVALVSHGRDGLERVRLGATAAGIVRASVVPVLVAPAREG
jgi:nucleotide-binding universal stress UspA family protein